MKQTKTIIKTYETGIENFMMDIEKTIEQSCGSNEEMYNVWIYRKNMGIKQYVIGELVKYYKDMTITQYAKSALEYCLIDWGNGNSFDFYDEEYQ